MPWSLVRHTPGTDPVELYKVVIEGAPAMLWLGDERGKCIFLNKSLREFWGVSVEGIASFNWVSTLHPDDVDALAGPFGQAMANRSEMTVEARYRRTDGKYRTLLTQARPRFDANGDFVGMVGVNIDLTDQRRNEKALRAARDALALAAEAARLALVEWDFENGLVRMDERGQDLFGIAQESAKLDDWLACLSSEDRSALQDEMLRAAKSGQPIDFVYRVVRSDGSERCVHGSGTIVGAGHGRLDRGTGLLRDVTEQWRELEFNRLLIGELNHRIKNFFAVAQSLISQSTVEGRSAAEFRSIIIGRLRALSDGLALTEGSASDTVSLGELAAAVLTPFRVDDGRIEITGPEVSIAPRLSRLICLVLHELATNAVKYGALSVSDGHVALGWELTRSAEGERVCLTWEEIGGPEVVAPKKQGFGQRLLGTMAELETGGKVEMTFRPTGLVYRLSLRIEPSDGPGEAGDAAS